MKMMKKSVSMMLAFIMCIVASIPAYATNEGVERGDFLGYSDDLEFNVIPEFTEMMIGSNTLNETDNGIEALAGYSTKNIFRIEEFKVYPVFIKDGEYQYPNYCWRYVPASTNLNVNYMMTLEKQKTLIDYVSDRGYEVVGWYLTGTFYMACYLPIRVDYRIYNHEQNGKTLWGVPITKTTDNYTGTATIKTFALFPNDMSKPYTYGFDGQGIMTIYDPYGGHSGADNKDFSLKATFEVE